MLSLCSHILSRRYTMHGSFRMSLERHHCGAEEKKIIMSTSLLLLKRVNTNYRRRLRWWSNLSKWDRVWDFIWCDYEFDLLRFFARTYIYTHCRPLLAYVLSAWSNRRNFTFLLTHSYIMLFKVYFSQWYVWKSSFYNPTYIESPLAHASFERTIEI